MPRLRRKVVWSISHKSRNIHVEDWQKIEELWDTGQEKKPAGQISASFDYAMAIILILHAIAYEMAHLFRYLKGLLIENCDS